MSGLSSLDTVYDCIVLGAGAAGMMCAREVALGGCSVLVLERSDTVGAKIRISGGGRCNFTNREVNARNFVSQNPDFCRSALARYSPDDFIAWIESEGIAYHEKTLGQLFCDASAAQIVDLFRRELDQLQVNLRVSTSLRSLSVEYSDDSRPMFHVETDRGSFRARTFVVASGGLSIPKMGATDVGHRIARQFGLRIVEPRPALVPLVLSAEWKPYCAQLSGVSFEAVARCGAAAFRENVLFTHRGLSGPAILQISSYWKPGLTVHLDLMPDIDDGELLSDLSVQNMELKNVLARHLPKRLAEFWCEREYPSVPLKQISAAQRARIVSLLHDWEIEVAGTEGFAKAEVTAGGVDTRDLSSKTMESTPQPGLYCIGEVVDMTGWLGGYNFQWAWSSAVAAGRAIALKLKNSGK